MSEQWKTVETFKQTEFGPRKTGETITTESCSNCKKLAAELDEAKKEIEDLKYELKENSERLE